LKADSEEVSCESLNFNSKNLITSRWQEENNQNKEL
jgi:hypothetical protein